MIAGSRIAAWAILALACAGTPQRVDIRAGEEYSHPDAGCSFPATYGPFERKGVWRDSDDPFAVMVWYRTHYHGSWTPQIAVGFRLYRSESGRSPEEAIESAFRDEEREVERHVAVSAVTTRVREIQGEPVEEKRATFTDGTMGVFLYQGWVVSYRAFFYGIPKSRRAVVDELIDSLPMCGGAQQAAEADGRTG